MDALVMEDEGLAHGTAGCNAISVCARAGVCRLKRVGRRAWKIRANPSRVQKEIDGLRADDFVCEEPLGQAVDYAGTAVKGPRGNHESESCIAESVRI